MNLNNRVLESKSKPWTVEYILPNEKDTSHMHSLAVQKHQSLQLLQHYLSSWHKIPAFR